MEFSSSSPLSTFSSSSSPVEIHLRSLEWVSQFYRTFHDFISYMNLFYILTFLFLALILYLQWVWDIILSGNSSAPSPPCPSSSSSDQSCSGCQIGRDDSHLIPQTHRKHRSHLLHFLHYLRNSWSTVVQGTLIVFSLICSECFYNISILVLIVITKDIFFFREWCTTALALISPTLRPSGIACWTRGTSESIIFF